MDLRAFQLLDIYSDENAYVNRHGFERPSARDLSGDTRFTMLMLTAFAATALLLGGVCWVSSSGVVAKVLADLDRVAFTGHSMGAAASLSYQGDPRVHAIIAFDGGDGERLGVGPLQILQHQQDRDHVHDRGEPSAAAPPSDH